VNDKRVSTSKSLIEAMLLSAASSLLFVLVYGWCNALASNRGDLGNCFFSWELRIPFMPVFIVPYLSIDLFFVASFFLCANRVELRTHASRIALAILIAGVAFLVFPLTVGYERLDVSGWTGSLFHFLWSFDKPHNLAPSLHIALASLLWPVYARRAERPLRWLVHGWFTLIVASPILTWQHHLLDVATGAMLGQVCLFVVPHGRDLTEDRGATRALEFSSPNFRVALFYATGSAVLGVLAIAFGSWFWLLLWPALSLALIAIAYVRGNSSVFRKTSGRLPISTRVVLGPYLLGMFARLLIYRCGRERWVEAAPGVYGGRLLTRGEALELKTMGITGVLDLTAEHAETRLFLETDYLNVPVLDLTRPSEHQIASAIAFISQHAGRGGVYVHCALGISRSAAVTKSFTESERNTALQLALTRSHRAIDAPIALGSH
jgi:membrane-associated phospholipid phosphatase